MQSLTSSSNADYDGGYQRWTFDTDEGRKMLGLFTRLIIVLIILFQLIMSVVFNISYTLYELFLLFMDHYVCHVGSAGHVTGQG